GGVHVRDVRPAASGGADDPARRAIDRARARSLRLRDRAAGRPQRAVRYRGGARGEPGRAEGLSRLGLSRKKHCEREYRGGCRMHWLKIQNRSYPVPQGAGSILVALLSSYGSPSVEFQRSPSSASALATEGIVFICAR